MLFGIDDNGKSIRASPDVKAKCSGCGKDMLAKCGQIKVWHFAHISSDECSFQNEPESEWHLAVKEFFLSKGYDIEVLVRKDGECRIADILHSEKKVVVEIQKSPISMTEVSDRTSFYRRAGYSIVWIFYSKEWSLDFRKGKGGNNYRSFRWKWPHYSLSPLWKAPIVFLNGQRMPEVRAFFDMTCYTENCENDSLLDVKKCYLEEGEYSGGWGCMTDMDTVSLSILKLNGGD